MHVFDLKSEYSSSY